ncbi:MAG: glycosyltransferase, partial [Deltaproteobacteria bacterium]|nr:glycosyltransferase [Deltaproteobacteria bacterium]
LPPLEGRLVIAHVANMTHPVKAHEDLFEAVRWLKARHPEILVLLVGDGARRAHLEALAGQAGLRGQVEFLGHRGDVPAILARCDLGVLCSHAEGLSNAIIEGMAARLPMVVTDAGGDAELVKDGARGFVVPVRAPLALSARLCALAEAPELRVRMGEAGRGFVESELTVQTLLRRHEALYLRVIEQRAGKQA